jgi:hypothetical protein
MLEEKESAEKCLALCTRASAHANQIKVNVFENNTAAKYASQLSVSTKGYPILARNLQAGEWATQWSGQCSDASLQGLSRDRAVMFSHHHHPNLDTSPEPRAEGPIILEDLIAPERVFR